MKKSLLTGNEAQEGEHRDEEKKREDKFKDASVRMEERQRVQKQEVVRKKETSPAYLFNMRIERPILVRNSSRSPHRHHISKICRAKYDKLSFI